METKEIAILKKLSGKELSLSEINEIIKGVNNDSISDEDIAYFVSAVEKHGMSLKETSYLTKAMAHSGKILRWGKKVVADKHCIGGIPGNRTTPIIVSICAAAGLTMPKTSSRSITSAAGTADVVEVLANVSLPTKELQKIVKKTGACLAWGGSLGLAPADEKLIKIEKKLNIDPGPQIVASILSKKIAAGSNVVLIDIPVGRGAKFSLEKGKKLGKFFKIIAKNFNMKIHIVFTDGSQPIGKGIGPVLEILDVLSVLNCENKVKDLEKKSIMLAGKLLELTGKASKGEGEKKAREILYSRSALKKFNEIIDAQGRVKNLILKSGNFSFEVQANKSGKIKYWNNKELNELGKILGCPEDKRAGIYIEYHVGEKVSIGDIVLTLYAESKNNLEKGKKFFKNNKFFDIK